jgi:hypothetical protein
LYKTELIRPPRPFRARTYADVEELMAAVADLVRRCNEQRLIERRGHRTPREFYQAWLQTREEVA